MIRMVLKGLKQLELQPLAPRGVDPKEDEVLVDVLACGVCRTDAKMWEQGHRDLVFPRVPGHEMVVKGPDGRRFMVWPGKSCTHCKYCRAGKENLCDAMEITGFHRDGGFAHRAVLPKASLIPMPEGLDIHIGCLGEPVGCVVNAFDAIPTPSGARVLIFGGGTMGLITALYARHLGLDPLILEKNEAKILKITPILDAWHLECVKETRESLFDIVITCCPDHTALCQAVTKVDKGGHISFFSGITKNRSVETNLLNLVHYKEARLIGAYGMKKSDIEKGLSFLVQSQADLGMLIEKVVDPVLAPDLMGRVLGGKDFKYILDFTGTLEPGPVPPSAPGVPADSPPSHFKQKVLDQSPVCRRILGAITPPGEIESAARAKMDDKSKPLGALGRLEDLGVTLSVIQNTLTPEIRRKALLVFAGDHGVTEEGVSAFPAEVTAQMVDNFLAGGAAINVLCRHHHIEMKVVDMGVKKEFSPHPGLIRAKVAPGTRNMALEPAMTVPQAVTALENGIRAFKDLDALETNPEKGPIHILGLGEMGIGNTTAATAVICAATGLQPALATGRGTGVDDKGLAHKTEVLEKVLAFHRPDPENGLEILAALGGFEMAGIAGAALAAASCGCAVVLDGVISTAAGLIAYLIHPGIGPYLISGHKSVEKAQAEALAHMNLTPVVDLDMRLGEGTGAAMAMDMAEAACKLMVEMASLDEARISRRPQ